MTREDISCQRKHIQPKSTMMSDFSVVPRRRKCRSFQEPMAGTRHVTQPGTEIMEISGRGEFIGGPNLADKDIVKHNPTSTKKCIPSQQT